MDYAAFPIIANVTPSDATITAKSGDLTATCEVFVGEEVHLSTIAADYTANNYDILTNQLDDAYAITIPDGYEVAFNTLTTTKTITCSGDATIILTDMSDNTVTGAAVKAGIQAGSTGKTLTIKTETAGTGKLKAAGGNNGAGIGTGEAGGFPPGATQECGNIAIGAGVTNVKAISVFNRIGKGKGTNTYQTCGTITFGTASVFDGTTWDPAPMAAGTYGGLNLAISTTTNDDDTWTLIPAP